MKTLQEQVGGDHYKKKVGIQPAEFCHSNKVGKLEGDVIYYVYRWRDKGGLEDLKKARHTLDILIELEEEQAVRDREKLLHSGARFSGDDDGEVQSMVR